MQGKFPAEDPLEMPAFKRLHVRSQTPTTILGKQNPDKARRLEGPQRHRQHSMGWLSGNAALKSEGILSPEHLPK